MKKRYRSEAEQEMANALGKAKIDFVNEYPIRGKSRYVLDFAILRKHKKIAIECDGEPWHSGKRDRKRDSYLRSKGWTILCFDAGKVLDDSRSCIEIIRAHIGI